MLAENYAEALSSFIKAYTIDSSNANINFKIGCCYAELPQKKKLGEKYFERAIADVTKKYKEDDPLFKKAPYYVYFYYAELLHAENKLEESKKMFKVYENYLNNDKMKDDQELLSHFEKMVEYAEEKEAYPVRISITNLGDSINSPYAEYAPVSDGEEKTLIFTYRGERTTGADEGLRTEEGKYFEDIFMSTRLPDGSWSKAKPINANINSKAHEASVSLTHDGKILIVYRDDDGDGNLYYSERNGNDWGELKKFNPEINSKYWEPSACISPDLNTLFFVSDRPGGFGGRDIYKCRRLPNGEWSKPVNLGSKINTKYDEDSPFLHSNGRDFYFSSNGHKSIGGFDIMVTELNESEEFGEIFTLPYPINTTEDDLFYFVSGDGKRAYYSSAYADSLAKGDNDIYVVSLEELNRKDRVFVRGGFILNNPNELKDSLQITIRDRTKGTTVGQYRPNAKGDFIAQLSLDSLYEVIYLQNNEPIKTESIDFRAKENIGKFGQELLLEKVPLKVKTVSSLLHLNLSVVNEYNSPVAGASVTIRDSLNSQQLITDSSGQIKQINLIPGRSYNISARKGDTFGETKISAGENANDLSKTLVMSSEKVVGNPSAPKSNLDFSELKGKSLRNKMHYDKLLELVRQIDPKGLNYKVQVAAFRKAENYNWKHLQELGIPDQLKLEDGITRFTYGLFSNLDECNKLLQKIIARGQRDAWITAVYKGKRYTLEQLIGLDFFIKSEF